MNAKDITLAGLMTAVSIIVLYLTTIIPINTFAILTCASLIIPICILRSNLKTGFLVYIATSILGFFLVPLNYFLMYSMFFGIYGIIKYFIERIRKTHIEIILKFGFFNIVFILALTVLKTFIGDLNIKLPMWLFIIAAEAAFFIFDYALTILISFYIEKFKHVK